MAGGWKGGFIIPMFFSGYCLGRAGADFLPGHPNVVVLAVCLMVAINVGVTKTPVGSTLVVTEMVGMRLLPPTLIAGMLSFFLTSNVYLIESQQQREGIHGPDSGLPTPRVIDEMTEEGCRTPGTRPSPRRTECRASRPTPRSPRPTTSFSLGSASRFARSCDSPNSQHATPGLTPAQHQLLLAVKGYPEVGSRRSPTSPTCSNSSCTLPVNWWTGPWRTGSSLVMTIPRTGVGCSCNSPPTVNVTCAT